MFDTSTFLRLQCGKCSCAVLERVEVYHMQVLVLVVGDVYLLTASPDKSLDLCGIMVLVDRLGTDYRVDRLKIGLGVG